MFVCFLHKWKKRKFCFIKFSCWMQFVLVSSLYKFENIYSDQWVVYFENIGYFSWISNTKIRLIIYRKYISIYENRKKNISRVLSFFEKRWIISCFCYQRSFALCNFMLIWSSQFLSLKLNFSHTQACIEEQTGPHNET